MPTNAVRAFTPLSDATLRSLPPAGADFDIRNQDGIIAPILIPRVAGTPGSQKVRDHFAKFFATQLPEWKVTYQNSTSKTPATGSKDVPFVNMIARRDPPWAAPGNVGYLTLVAHYDSKLTPDGFIGAVDSAAPCAMILHAARSLESAMAKKWAAVQASGEQDLEETTGLQILLLDGEEAMVDWTDTDSLYGARSLAEEWDRTFHPALSTYRTELSSITQFVLLDLLGSANPIVPSYWSNTHWAYKNMAALEKRMRSPSLSVLSARPKEQFFLRDAEKTSLWWAGPMMQDDHVPFLQRGVEVLHLIPTPFPAVWHKMEDDGEHLDGQTVEEWGRIVMAFVAEWMDLETWIEITPETKAAEEAKKAGEAPKVEGENGAANGAINRRKTEL